MWPSDPSSLFSPSLSTLCVFSKFSGVNGCCVLLPLFSPVVTGRIGGFVLVTFSVEPLRVSAGRKGRPGHTRTILDTLELLGDSAKGSSLSCLSLVPLASLSRSRISLSPLASLYSSIALLSLSLDFASICGISLYLWMSLLSANGGSLSMVILWR